MPDVFVGEFNTDIAGPIISVPFPVDGAVDVDSDTVISFQVTESTTGASGVDLNSVVVKVDGVTIYSSGAAVTGWSATVTPLAEDGDYAFELTKAGGLSDDRTYEVFVAASDLAPIPNEADELTWSFTTEPIFVVSPILYAIGVDGAVRTSWYSDPENPVIRFELRRSIVSTPLTPDQGELIYSGTLRRFIDENVMDGIVYKYTIFLVYKIFEGEDFYVPYEPVASQSAAPRKITVARINVVEYRPSKDEFGRVSTVVDVGSSSVWGDIQSGRRDSDVIKVRPGKPVRCPCDGVVSSVSGAEQSRVVVIDSDQGGFRYTVTGVNNSKLISVGRKMKAGDVMGQVANAGVVEFSIVKLAVGGYGQRTVRPTFFYLTVEKRTSQR